jgi:hypothetical protein
VLVRETDEVKEDLVESPEEAKLEEVVKLEKEEA